MDIYIKYCLESFPPSPRQGSKGRYGILDDQNKLKYERDGGYEM